MGGRGSARRATPPRRWVAAPVGGLGALLGLLATPPVGPSRPVPSGLPAAGPATPAADADAAIDDRLIKRVAQHIDETKAAVVLLGDDATIDFLSGAADLAEHDIEYVAVAPDPRATSDRRVHPVRMMRAVPAADCLERATLTNTNGGRSNNMATLVAIGYPDEETAAAAAQQAEVLADELIIQPDAIAVVRRDRTASSTRRPATIRCWAARPGACSGASCSACCSSCRSSAWPSGPGWAR